MRTANSGIGTLINWSASRFAHRRLGTAPRGLADEEDVVLSAFDSFLRAVDRERFSELEDRSDLWQILVMITERKAISARRKAPDAKRGGGKVVGETTDSDSHDGIDLGQLVGLEPTPEFSLQVTEEFERLMALLADDELREIAVARLEGFTNEDIAQRLNVTSRTVERRLNLIRRLWEQDQQDE